MEAFGINTTKQASPSAEWGDTLLFATHALAHLDADRLEEMALSCVALVQEGTEARFDANARREMAIFARVLDASRANLKVLRRLCEIRETQLEYDQPRTLCGASKASEHGDD